LLLVLRALPDGLYEQLWLPFVGNVFADGVSTWVIAVPLVIVLLLGALRIGYAYLVVVNTDYVITTEYVYKKTGIVTEQTTRIGLDRIQHATLSRSFLGNMFDYGTIEISTAGDVGVQMALPYLGDPDSFRVSLKKARTRTLDGETTGPGTGKVDGELARRVIREARQLRSTAEQLAEGDR
jgi:uncharacterized membrane protein YdbT with pleckstrin-like domain